MGRGLGHAERWRISQLLPDPMPVRRGSSQALDGAPASSLADDDRRRPATMASSLSEDAAHRPAGVEPTRSTRDRQDRWPTQAGRIHRAAPLVAPGRDAPALDRTLRALGIPTASGPGQVRGPVRLDTDTHLDGRPDAPSRVLLGFGDEGSAYVRDHAGAELWPDPDGKGVWLAWRDASDPHSPEQPVAVLLAYDYAFGLLEQLLSLTTADDIGATRDRTRGALDQWQQQAGGW